MYSTCLFCHKPLGLNEVIEPFPVGRRLAFDQARGRLWVVCRRCEKWNLSPLEERWEAIEECERRFRDARKRVASENVGLARLDEGLELVRIGDPLRPEFAAWRYGDQFGRRRRRAIVRGVGLAAVGGGIMVAGTAAGVLGGGGYWVWQLADGAYKGVRRRMVVARIPQPGELSLVVRGKHLEKARVIGADEAEGGWGLELPHESGTVELTGDRARRAAALLMPRVNRGGASPRKVQNAVKDLERSGDPARFLRASAQGTVWEARLLATDEKMAAATRLQKLPLETRLAIEMALNEENERIALEGELALLELEWKDAEEIAAIADRLTVPEQVDEQLERLRRRAGRTGEA